MCSLRGAIEVEPSVKPPAENLRVLGDYEILGEIAQGGMGVVFRARQRSLGRTVAVKMILAGHFASDAARHRFRAEASAAAKLQHPNIVGIHDIGEHEGQPYFSMDLVEGRTLADALHDGLMPPREAAACVKAMAEAIHYAHERGVVHRDLKPSNVLLDAAHVPHITDFGIAIQMGGETARLTLSGQVLGSPAYVSPEQARGVAGETGPATDIYSLGAILYQLITGRPPFQGDSAQAILRQVESDEPLSPRRLNPSAPVDLETICLKCLEKEPSRRYSGAQELANDLQRYLNGELVRARPVGRAGRLWRWSMRHPMVAGLSASVLVLLVVVAVGSSVAALRIKQGEVAATANLRVALLSQARALRLAGQVGRRAECLAAIEQSNRLNPTPEQRFQLRNEAIASLALSDLQFVPAPELAGQSDPCLIRFDPRFESFVAVERNSSLVLRRLIDGKELARVPLEGARVEQISGFSADGRFAVLRHGYRHQLVDIATRRRLRDNAGVLAFSSDSRRMVEVGENGNVIVFEIPEFREVRRFTNVISNGSGLALAAWSSDDKLLAVVGPGERVVTVMELSTGTVCSPLVHDTRLTALVWRADDQLLSAGAADGRISVWDARAGKRLLTMKNPSAGGAVSAMAFDPSRVVLASAYDGGTVDVWDGTGELKPLTVAASAGQLIFARGNRRLGCVVQRDRPGWIEFVRSDVLRTTKPAAPQSGTYQALFSPDGQLASAVSRSRLYLIEPDTAREQARFDFETIRAAQFGPAGESLFFCGAQGVFSRPLVRGTNGGWELGARKSWLTGANWGALTVADEKHHVVAVNLSSSELWIQRDMKGTFVRFAAHPGVFTVASSRSGGIIASGSRQTPHVRLWRGETGHEIRALDTSGDARVVLSPDGQWVAAFGNGCQVWSTADETVTTELVAPKHGSPVQAVAFSSDSSLLALVPGAGANEIQLFDPGTGRLLAILQGPAAERVQDLAFSPAGLRLAATTPDGIVKLWDLERLAGELRTLNLAW